jgi:hypothetical protein
MNHGEMHVRTVLWATTFSLDEAEAAVLHVTVELLRLR